MVTPELLLQETAEGGAEVTEHSPRRCHPGGWLASVPDAAVFRAQSQVVTLTRPETSQIKVLPGFPVSPPAHRWSAAPHGNLFHQLSNASSPLHP